MPSFASSPHPFSLRASLPPSNQTTGGPTYTVSAADVHPQYGMPAVKMVQQGGSRIPVATTGTGGVDASANQPPPPPPFSVGVVAVPYTGPNAGKFRRIAAADITISPMSFDEVTVSLVGFAETKTSSGSYKKILKKFNTVTHKETIIGDVPTMWQGEMGPIAAVDSPNRKHYSLLMKAQHSGWEPSTGVSRLCGGFFLSATKGGGA
jgi:hypothetical protein